MALSHEKMKLELTRPQAIGLAVLAEGNVDDVKQYFTSGPQQRAAVRGVNILWAAIREGAEHANRRTV